MGETKSPQVTTKSNPKRGGSIESVSRAVGAIAPGLLTAQSMCTARCQPGPSGSSLEGVGHTHIHTHTRQVHPNFFWAPFLPLVYRLKGVKLEWPSEHPIQPPYLTEETKAQREDTWPKSHRKDHRILKSWRGHSTEAQRLNDMLEVRQ